MDKLPNPSHHPNFGGGLNCPKWKWSATRKRIQLFLRNVINTNHFAWYTLYEVVSIWWCYNFKTMTQTFQFLNSSNNVIAKKIESCYAKAYIMINSVIDSFLVLLLVFKSLVRISFKVIKPPFSSLVAKHISITWIATS